MYSTTRFPGANYTGLSESLGCETFGCDGFGCATYNDLNKTSIRRVDRELLRLVGWLRSSLYEGEGGNLNLKERGKRLRNRCRVE